MRVLLSSAVDGGQTRPGHLGILARVLGFWGPDPTCKPTSINPLPIAFPPGPPIDKKVKPLGDLAVACR
jgi:hypothetical protein